MKYDILVVQATGKAKQDDEDHLRNLLYYSPLLKSHKFDLMLNQFHVQNDNDTVLIFEVKQMDII